jgi:hypothetical protein
VIVVSVGRACIARSIFVYFISMIWSRTCEDQFYFYALVKNIWRLVETTWWETNLFPTMLTIYLYSFYKSDIIFYECTCIE